MPAEAGAFGGSGCRKGLVGVAKGFVVGSTSGVDGDSAAALYTGTDLLTGTAGACK